MFYPKKSLTKSDHNIYDLIEPEDAVELNHDYNKIKKPK